MLLYYSVALLAILPFVLGVGKGDTDQLYGQIPVKNSPVTALNNVTLNLLGMGGRKGGDDSDGEYGESRRRRKGRGGKRRGPSEDSEEDGDANEEIDFGGPDGFGDRPKDRVGSKDGGSGSRKDRGGSRDRSGRSKKDRPDTSDRRGRSGNDRTNSGSRDGRFKDDGADFGGIGRRFTDESEDFADRGRRFRDDGEDFSDRFSPNRYDGSNRRNRNRSPGYSSRRYRDEEVFYGDRDGGDWERDNDICDGPNDFDDCDNRRMRWYFDSYNGNCRRYYTCGGSSQGFRSRRRCDAECNSYFDDIDG